jgi:hypothetical protein
VTKIILDKVFAPIACPRRNIRCITFTATASLVAAMLAHNIPVKRHPVYPEQFVSPDGANDNGKLWELLNDSRFQFLGVVTFLVTPTGINQTFNIPGNWNSSNNKIETIAGGASGGAAFGTAGFVSASASGAGAGAYSSVTNLVFVPGSTAIYQIGIGGAAVVQTTVNAGTNGNNGGDSWFNGTTLAGSSVGAKAGLAGQGSGSGGALAGGAGGPASGGTGSTKRNGGAGGATAATGGGGISSAGGGGAGGPNGDGSPGGAAANGATSNGGNADNNTVPGGAGGAPNGSPGGNGAEFDGSHGCGGGGGGAISANLNTVAGSGGNYGGGGGGAASDTGSSSSATSGAGIQGIIVVTNIPATTASLMSRVIG